jgi:preprotein translocase subunit SecD
MNMKRWLTTVWFSLIVAVCISLIGCAQKEPMYKPTGQPRVKLAIRLAKTVNFPEAEEVMLPKDKEFASREGAMVTKIFVAREEVLTNADVSGTSVGLLSPESERWQVEVFLTPSGRDKFARFTKDNVGHMAAIFFDDKLQMAPLLYSVITEGRVAISGGNLTEAQATELAKGLVGQ